MYKVTADNITIHDLILETELIEPVVTLEESKAGTFRFDIAPENPGYDILERLKTVVSVYDENDLIFRGRVLSLDESFSTVRSVICEGELAYLLDSVQRPTEYHNITPRVFLQRLITNHNNQVEAGKRFTLGNVTVTDSNDSIYRYTNWENTLTCIKDKLLSRLGGRLVVRYSGSTRYLDYLADYNNVNEQVIELGENLLDYSSSISAGDIATICVPLGARLDESPIQALEAYTTIASVNNGNDYVQIASAVSKYGQITKVVRFNDVTVPANLKKKGEEWLQDAQYEELVLELSAVDLSLYDVNYSRIKMGERVRVLSDAHGMNRLFPVTQMKVNLTDPGRNTLRLGTSEKNKSLTDRNAQAQAATYRQFEELPSQSSILATAKENATSLIHSATHGYCVVEPNEILIMNTPDKETATKVWRFNMGGLGYSNQGYNGEYGLAMTMDGAIVADRITTGTLNAERVKAGILSALNKSSNYWNMNTGEFHMGTDGQANGIDYKNGTLTINASNIATGQLEAARIKVQDIQISGGQITSGTIAAIRIPNLDASKITSGTIDASTINVTNLNASNITSGTITAERVKTGTLSDETGANSWDLTNGIVSMEGSFRSRRSGDRNTYAEMSSGAITINASNGRYFQVNAYSSGAMFLRDSDNSSTIIGFGKNTSTFQGNVYFYGSVYNSSGGVVFTSDARKKKEIKTIDAEKAETFIMSLRPRRFKFIEGTSDREHHGFIAQELKDAMGEDDWGVFVTDENGVHGVRHDEIIADLVAVVQKQRDDIKNIKKRIQSKEDIT